MRTSNKLIIIAFVVILSSIPMMMIGNIEPLVAIVPAYFIGYVIMQIAWIYRKNEQVHMLISHGVKHGQ